MGMSIEDIKHCLNVMVDCEVCEECNLYGTTGTDHCEYDCVRGALKIIDKYDELKASITMMRLDYEAKLKADLEAILVELQLEIEELDTPNNGSAYIDCVEIIQQIIDKLKGNEDGNE